MSKLKVTTIANVADSESTDVTNVINGSAKAWVNFDGTFGSSPFTVANGGIRAAFNVSSVTDNGTGDYTVNFTNAMPDANYSVSHSCQYAEGSFALNNLITAIPDGAGIQSTGSIRLRSYGSPSNTAYDVVRFLATIFR